MEIISYVKSDEGYKLFLSDGREIGQAVKMADGKYHYWVSSGRYSFFDPVVLTSIANTLLKLDKLDLAESDDSLRSVK